MLNPAPALDSALSANQGQNGIALAASAERLLSTLWAMVISGMLKDADGGALGTGSGLLNDLGAQSASGELFGGTDSSITSAMLKELKGNGAQGSADSGAAPTRSMVAEMLSAGPSAEVAGGSGMLGASLAGAVSFAKSIWPLLVESARSLGVPPVALLAQSALETGWGTSMPGNNLFGIKAHGGLPETVAATMEEQNGRMQPAISNFASYTSPAMAVSDYTNLIEARFSDSVGAASVPAFAASLQSEGYATDNRYASKIISIAQSPLMADVLRALGVEESAQ